ncbi:MAG: SDR family oxidoreductase [Phycisphaerae bacterium]|nr:SDR family oxidoreductase [Phycisphaerae bacterium]
MANRLFGKVVLVTGASRGIGRATATALAADGATVVLAARAVDELARTAEAVRQAGGEALTVPVELTDEASIRSLVATVEQKLGRLDVLINNAGVTHSGPLQDTPTDRFDHLMAVNVRGPFILIREALPLLCQSDCGIIVNVSSVVGVKGYPYQSAYTASKHALRGMSIALAEELRAEKRNVRVHVICPGGVDTEMVSRVRPDIDKQDLIRPEEIAELIRYLVTHEGNAVVDELHIRRATSSPWF